MTCNSLSKALPFENCNSFMISQLFQSKKSMVLESLEANNFSKNIIKLVNGFSKNNYTCGYYQEESINNLSQKHLPDCLKIFHLNIVSFSKNGSKLSSYLKCLKFKFDIICLTEIRKTHIGIIDKEFNEFHIYTDIPQLNSGGVAILLRKNKFEQITELDSNDNFNLKNNCTCNNCQVENKWLSFKVNNQEIVLGGIYRHPKGNVEHFNKALNNTLNHINENSIAIILGDTNINLMLENKETIDTYLNNFYVKNYIPCITLPSRISNHSATIIDHIFIKNPAKLIQNKCSSGNLITDLSDHLPNFTFLDLKTPTSNDRPYVRLFTENNIKAFTENLHAESALINDNDLTDSNYAYDTFSNNYLSLFNKYFPYKRLSRKNCKDKPYITTGLKVSIRTKNKLYHKYLNNPSELNKAIWKRYRNKTNNCIKRSEEKYYRTILRSQKNSSRNLWKTFGKILNKKKIAHKKLFH